MVAVKIFSPYNVFNSYSRRDQLSNCKKVLFVKLAFVGAAERMVRMILVFRGAALHLAAAVRRTWPPPHGHSLIGFEFTDLIILHQFSLMEKLIKNSKPSQLMKVVH